MSVGFEDQSYDESAFADETAQSLGCSAQKIFQYPTPSQLSLWIESRPLVASKNDFNKIRKTKRLFPIPLSSAQKRFWFLSELSPAGSYNILLCWKLTGPLNIDYLIRSVNKLRQQYEILRTIYKKKDSELYQEILTYHPLGIKVEKITEAERTSLLAQENSAPFLLDKLPPFRVRLLHVDNSYYILLINLSTVPC